MLGWWMHPLQSVAGGATVRGGTSYQRRAKTRPTTEAAAALS